MGLAQVCSVFTFELEAPLAKVAPLFGPAAERCWAGRDWNPEFIYPADGRDREGCVFRLRRRGREETWVNTVFDPAAGRAEYAAFVPGVMVTVVMVRLAAGGGQTRVEVTYRRTALVPEANPEIERLGAADRESGSEWQAALAAALSNGQV